jgi:DNA polymerase V
MNSSLALPAVDRGPYPVPLFPLRVPAGFPSPADDYAEESLDFNRLLVADPPVTVAMRVTGDSMIGAGILDGDLIVVNRGLVARPGDVVVAILDGEFTVKRLKKTGRSSYALVPENPDYPAIYLDDASELTVLGVVVHAIHSFDSAGRTRSKNR